MGKHTAGKITDAEAMAIVNAYRSVTKRQLWEQRKELLEACKCFVSCAGPGAVSFMTAKFIARAAIAKAEPK